MFSFCLLQWAAWSSSSAENNNLCLLHLCSSQEKVSVRQQDCSHSRNNPRISGLWLCNCPACSSVQRGLSAIKERKCFENTFQKLKNKKHHRRIFLPLKGPSPFLRDWDNVRCLCYSERGAALPEGWHSRNILQDKHAASQKICSQNTCVTHTGLFCDTYPIQCLLKAGEPVFSGHGIICEVNSVWDIGGGVFQQWQVNKWSLQSVHFQHVKLGEKWERWIRTHSEINSQGIKLAQGLQKPSHS